MRVGHGRLFGQRDQLQKIGQASLETAKKMGTLNGKLELARERSLFTSNETEELARQLERQGKVQQLNNLLSNEYQQIVGSKGTENLRRLNEVSSEFNRLMGILKTKFDAFIAGPLADLLSFLNKSLSADATAGQFREFRKSLKGSQKEFFEEQLKELRGTRGKSSGPITTAIMEEMLKRFPASAGETASHLKAKGHPFIFPRTQHTTDVVPLGCSPFGLPDRP